MRTPHLPFTEFAPLPVYEVQALHDMAMGGIKNCVVKRGVRIRSDALMRKHIYVVFNDSGCQVGDEAVDSYLGVRVIKQAPREWRMGISFLENSLETSRVASNRRELNTFIWNDSQAFGMRRIREAIGKVQDEYAADVAGQTILVVKSDETVRREIRSGLTVNDCDSIASRMCEAAINSETSLIAA